MKLLIDMNLSPRWVDLLTEAGIETVHWTSVGPINAPDGEIMAFARSSGFIVLTHDLDFSAVLEHDHAERNVTACESCDKTMARAVSLFPV